MSAIDRFIRTDKSTTTNLDPLIVSGMILAICYTGGQALKNYGIQEQALIQIQADKIISKDLQPDALARPPPTTMILGTMFTGILATSTALIANNQSQLLLN